MEIKYDDKYWRDYSTFIMEVEHLTGLSPSDLLSRYQELVSEMSDNDEKDYLEWQYELSNDMWTRQKIQTVIDYEPIYNNVLLDSFKEKVESLDQEIKKQLLNSEQADWWEGPILKFNRT